MRYVISKNTGGMTYKYLCINSNSGFIACGEICISYMLQLIGAESLPASVLYPFITGGSIILTSFAGVAFLKEKLTIRQWMAVTACFVGTLLFL